MAVKEANVPESRVPKRARPWNMRLQRSSTDEDILISVKGAGNGTKARFHVNLNELDRAVQELKG